MMTLHRDRLLRIQDNILAASERRLLDALCRRAPAWVTPDRLTALGLAGGGVVLAGDWAGRWRAPFLWLAILGYLMHWLGDSLDGSLARYRRIERPRYGALRRSCLRLRSATWRS